MNAFARSALLGLATLALLLSVGSALGNNVPEDEASDEMLVSTENTAPQVTEFRITDGDDVDVLHTQLLVLQTYYFNVTVNETNRWDDLTLIEVRIWHDDSGGKAFGDQTTGANYRAVLEYNNSDALDEPLLSQWSVAEGNLVYNDTDSQIITNVVNENYTFKLSFQLREQMRQADAPGTHTTGYDSANSWNAEVLAEDQAAAQHLMQQNATTDEYHEFGIFQYTEVTVSTGWTIAEIAPGETKETTEPTITHKSNRAYNLTVWFAGHLTNNGETITVDNVEVLPTGDLAEAQAFNGTGEANAIFIYGGVTAKAHETDDNETTTPLKFRVHVPLGTPAGTYTANVFLKVEQPAS